MTRTVGRLALVVALALGVGGLAPADAAHAHRGVTPTVFHDGRGSVWITVVWEDGHPLHETVVATISGADETGRHFGPVALRSLDRSSPMTLTYSDTLAPGRWATTVDIAAPGTGYCTAQLTVSPAGTPERFDCAVPTSAASTDTADGWGIVALTLAVALLIIGTVAIRRHAPAVSGKAQAPRTTKVRLPGRRSAG